MSTDIPEGRLRVLQDVALERAYQDEKFPGQDHPMAGWLLVLQKHTGRVASDVLDLAKADLARHHLVRVAAIAVAAIESIDRRKR